MISETHNVDCMEFMAGLLDGFFDLVIADPPYGIGEDGGSQRTRGSINTNGVKKNWDNKRPDESFFLELMRVSKNQIICGGNYFADMLPASRCWIYWQKNIGGDFADGELCWTSFDKVLKEFTKRSQTFNRQHPTQKPVALYKWLLTNYAKPGQKIFDPMMGSQSSRIASHDMGFDYWGCELDAEYFRDGEARYKAHIAKPVLFPPDQMYFHEQVKLF